jgi:hypothetical protein
LGQREQRLRASAQTSMFDLWGQAAEGPPPLVEVPDFDATPQEKSGWERELLGVYLSGHPFILVAQELARRPNYTPVSQISDALKEQRITTGGVLSSSRVGFTKQGKPFASGLLEDTVGNIEVIAWSEVYERAKDLWTESNTLVITGRLRERDDRLTLVCDQVELFQPGSSEGVTEPSLGNDGPEPGLAGPNSPAELEAQLPPPVAPAQTSVAVPAPAPLATAVAVGPEATGERPPEADAGAGSTAPAGHPSGNGNDQAQKATARPARRAPKNGPRQRLVVSLVQTEEADADVDKLRRVVATMQEYAGIDEVRLSVIAGGDATELMLPHLKVRCCDELRRRLAEIAGPDAVAVEQALL